METSVPGLRLPPPGLRGGGQPPGRMGQAPSWMCPAKMQSDGEQGPEGAQEARPELDLSSQLGRSGSLVCRGLQRGSLASGWSSATKGTVLGVETEFQS